MIVRTFEGLQALTSPEPSWWEASSGSVSLYDYQQTYFEIFKAHPNVRICVEFLGRNVADVPPQVFRRVSDTDRVRLADHDLARWLSHPNPATTRYRLFEALVIDLGIYDRAFWLKVRYLDARRRDAIGFVRLPPDEMTVEGGLLPTGFVWTTADGREKRFAPSEIVYFAGYRLGISPLETLRRILAEEAAAGENRESFWRNAGRMEGIVERPAGAPRWSPDQKRDWRAQWREFSAGGPKAGEVGVLEDGMTMKPWSFSAKDSEYTAGGKLRREVCAAVYQIPQPFVGILDHATFSNIREQHKNLYQDCLGPWFEMLRQELHRQVLIECADQTDVYVEFNIDKKLAGTPEDRANAMQVSIGRPWRTVNEGRALDNLPRIDDPALDTVAPQQGGPSDATAQPTDRPAAMMRRAGDAPADDSADAAIVAPIVQAWQGRILARLEKLPVPERAAAFDRDRWRRDLVTNLTPLVGADRAAAVAARGVCAEQSRLAGEAAA